MKTQTIQQLNALNNAFYVTTASEFSETRSRSWSGWEQLVPFFQKYGSDITVLDVGCGNGRFGNFLDNHLPQQVQLYCGIEKNSTLIEEAKQATASRFSQTSFIQLDIIEKLLSNQPLVLDDQSFDVITVFGVLHHIPSLQLRKALLQQLAKYLKPNGVLIFTAWQFDRSPNLWERREEASHFNIDPTELEPGDYFLTWERGVSAARYCHLITEKEIEELVSSSGLQQETTFSADGPHQNLNTYVLLSKKNR